MEMQRFLKFTNLKKAKNRPRKKKNKTIFLNAAIALSINSGMSLCYPALKAAWSNGRS
jgi:hypothetical protein